MQLRALGGVHNHFKYPYYIAGQCNYLHYIDDQCKVPHYIIAVGSAPVTLLVMVTDPFNWWSFRMLLLHC